MDEQNRVHFVSGKISHLFKPILTPASIELIYKLLITIIHQSIIYLLQSVKIHHAK